MRTAVDEVAVLNDTSLGDLGTLTLRNVTVGQVPLLADHAVRAGHVVVDGLQVEQADVRGRAVRPNGFGVEALQAPSRSGTVSRTVGRDHGGVAQHRRGLAEVTGGGIRLNKPNPAYQCA